MKQFLYLLKATYASSISIRKSKKSKIKKNLAIPQILLSLVILVGYGAQFAINLLGYKNVGADILFIEKYCQITITFSIIYCLCFTLAFSPSIFFDSNNDAFLCLPISGFKLYLARLTLNFVFSTMYGGSLILAQLLIACIILNLPFYSYIMAFLVYLGLIVTINFLSFSIMNLISRIKNLNTNKNFASILNFVFICLGSISLALLTILIPTKQDNMSTSENMQYLIGMLNRYYQWTFFVNWSGIIPIKSVLLLDTSYYIYILYGGIIDVVLIGVGYVISNFYYIKNLNSGYKKSLKRSDKKKTKYIINKAFKKRKQISMLIKKEFSILKANPLICFNSIFTCLVMGINFTLIAYFTVPVLNQNGMYKLARIMISLFLVMSIYIPFLAYMSISLDGKSFQMLKTFPLNIRKYIFSKMSPCVLFTFIYSALICVIYFFLFKFSSIEMILNFLLAVSFGLFICMNSFFLGARFPNFYYSSSSELQKGAGPFLVSILNLVFPSFSFGINVGFYFINENLVFMGYLISSIIYIGLTVLFYKKSYKKVYLLFKEDF